MKAEEELVNCRKCGMPHRVDEYRGVKHYVCPVKNVVLLLVQNEESEPASAEQKSYE